VIKLNRYDGDFMSKYFSNRNYILLYLENFLANFANSIYSVFTPVLLYKAGVSISSIFFIYAVQFLVMGLLTPLSGVLSKKFGVAVVKLLNYFLKALSLFFVLKVNINIYYYLLISITYGLSGAINNPLNTFIPGKIVDNGFRGRFNSFKYILRCFSSVLGYIFVTVFLIQDNQLVILLTVLSCYLLAFLAVVNLDKDKFHYDVNNYFSTSYEYLFKSKDNKYLKRVSILRSFIIIENLIVVPLFLFIKLDNLKVFTAIYVISTLIELFSLFISGIKLDKNDTKAFGVISFIKSINSLMFVVFKSKFLLLINQSFFKLIGNVYESSYVSLLQNQVENDKEDSLVLSMVHEMGLCFGEFVFLIVFCIISLFDGFLTFNIVFICSIFVVILNNRMIKLWK